MGTNTEFVASEGATEGEGAWKRAQYQGGKVNARRFVASE